MTTPPSTPLLLPGQAAAPEGPIDLSMMYVLHHGFRRDLTRFVDAARLTPLDDGRAWRALVRRWDVFARLLHDHHHKEDDHVWPLLRTVAADDAAALAVLDEMEAEHDVIDPLLERARNGLVAMADQPGAGRRHALEQVLISARSTLDQHLGHEETDAIALVQRYVDPAAWEHLDRTALRGGLGPRDMLTLVPWAVEDLPQDVSQDLLRAAPPFRVFHLLGRRRFARLERAAFGRVLTPAAA